jgi:hypothetical protein
MTDKMPFIQKVGNNYRVDQSLKPVDISQIDENTENGPAYFAIIRSEDKEYTHAELLDLWKESNVDYAIHIGVKHGFIEPIWNPETSEIEYKTHPTKYLEFLAKKKGQ